MSSPVVCPTRDLAARVAQAAAYGGSAARYLHNDTYDELLATGNLGKIADPELRAALAVYFGFVRGGLFKEFESIPPRLLFDYARLTGYLPVDAPESPLGAEHARIASFVRTALDEDYRRDLRLIRARCVRHLAQSRLALERNARLQADIAPRLR